MISTIIENSRHPKNPLIYPGDYELFDRDNGENRFIHLA
jgi:hypothetical protein